MEQIPQPVIAKFNKLYIWKKISNKFFIILAVVLLAVIATTLIVYFAKKSSPNSNTAFTINGQLYSKNQVNTLVNSAGNHHVPTFDVNSDILNYYKQQYVANQLNIKPSTSEIQSATDSLFSLGPNAKLDPWEYMQGWQSVLSDTLSLDNSGEYMGGILFFPFNQLTVSLLQGFPKPSNWGNAAAINAAQTYAQSQAEYYSNLLKTNKTTLSNALSAVKSDTKLQFAGSLNSSVEFTVNSDGYSLVNQDAEYTPLTPSGLTEIKSFNKVGLTPIQLQSSTYPASEVYNGQTSIPVDYYFIDVQSIVKPKTDVNKNYNSSLKNLNVKIYDNSI